MKSIGEATLTLHFATKLVPTTLRCPGKDSVLIGGFSVAPRHEFWGPKSMEIYRWRFKNLSKLWILVRTFICIKLVICMFLLKRYHHKLIDNSYSNVKIVQNVMVIWQLAKLWIILALKFSELLLQLIVLYRLVVQQNA